MLYNLKEIHRPTDVDEAVKLLRRKDVRTLAIAGGTSLVGEGGPEVEAVVDLDGLGLDRIERTAEAISLGATVRLQTLSDELADVAGGLLADAAHRMAGWHIRNAATVGGSLFSAPPTAPLLPVLVALGAEVTLYAPKMERMDLLRFLEGRAEYGADGALLTAVDFPVPADGVGFAFDRVGRTPADDPIVCAVARADSVDGEGRVWLGGVGPDVVALAGDDTSGLPAPPSDFLGSSEYRAEMAAVLARRTLAQARANAAG